MHYILFLHCTYFLSFLLLSGGYEIVEDESVLLDFLLRAQPVSLGGLIGLISNGVPLHIQSIISFLYTFSYHTNTITYFAAPLSPRLARHTRVSTPNPGSTHISARSGWSPTGLGMG